MSAITLNHRLTFAGREYTIPSIPRLVAVNCDDSTRYIDEIGFRQPHTFTNCSTILDAKQLLQFGKGSGVIIGEGDIGKTWFTEQLEKAADDYLFACVLQLREYRDKSDQLSTDANKFWDACEGKSGHFNLILDGLDENNDAWGTISNIIRQIDDKDHFHVLVTSRMCDGVVRLRTFLTNLTQYKLLPFSKEDLIALAVGVHANGGDFLSAIEQKNVSTFASRPGGATLLLQLYGMGIIQSKDTSELMREIARGFVHKARDGVCYESSKTPFDDAKAADGASWIATKLFFSQKWRIWEGQRLMCPAEAIPYDELFLERNYDRSLIKYVMESRLIEPLSDHLRRFASDTALVPFLVGDWICSHVPQETIPLLFKTETVGDTTASVMSWIARIKPNYVAKWINERPLIFLGCDKAITAYGVKKYYTHAQKHYEHATANERESVFKHCDETMASVDILSECATATLAESQSSILQILFATAILKRTGQGDTSTVDTVTECTLRKWAEMSTGQRVEILYALFHLVDNQPIAHPVLSQLKVLLETLTPSQRGDDSCRGILLMLLWPHYLTVQELTQYLTPPTPHIYGDAYLTFRTTTLLDSLEESIDEKSVVTLLHTLQLKDETLDAIFTFAWKWAENPDVAKALAHVILTRSKRDNCCHFELPFSAHSRFGAAYDWGVSSLDCERDQPRRFAVLDAVIHQEPWADDDFVHMRCFGERYGLFTIDEFNPLYRLWSAAHQRKDQIAERRLIRILANLSGIRPLDEFIEERNTLHALYPDIPDFDLEQIRMARDEFARTEKEFDDQKRAREASLEEARSKHNHQFPAFILKAPLKDDLFIQIAHYLNSEDGTPSVPELDIYKTKQWALFDDKTKLKVYEAATETVCHYKGESDSPTSAMAFCSALFVTWKDEKHSAKRLSCDEWERVFSIATHALFSGDDSATCEKMLSWGFSHFEKSCTRGLIKATLTETTSTNGPASTIGRWLPFVTDSLISALIDNFKDDQQQLSSLLRAAFRARQCYGQNLNGAEKFLSGLFSNPREAIQSGHGELFAIALAFCPSVYAESLVDFFDLEPESAKRWLESVADQYHELIESAFCNVSVATAARFYLKLSYLYPPEKNPHRNGEAHFMSSIDYVYDDLIRDLQKRITQEPSAASLAAFNTSELCNKPYYAGIRDRIKVELEKASPPELVSPDILTRIACEERPISELTLKEQRVLAKEYNKDLATKEDILERGKQLLIEILTHPLVTFKRAKTISKGNPITPADQRALNEHNLAQALHDAAFDLLGLTQEDRKKVQKEYAIGKYWADKLHIRQNTVGEIIDLRGKLSEKGKKPASVPQLYFEICSNEDYFQIFAEIEKDHKPPRHAMEVYEHARQLKNEIEARTKNNK